MTVDCSLLGILQRPAAALADAPVDSDEAAPLLRLVCVLTLVPEGDRYDGFIGTFPDKLFLSAGSVSSRGPDAQHLLNGLQHGTFSAAIGARYKIDMWTAAASGL